MLLTDRHQLPPGRTLPGTVREAISAGAHAVLIRERDLPLADRLDLAEAVQTAGAQAILAWTGAEPASFGLHLRSADPAPDIRPALLGRSVHNAAELAASQSLDYVTLSPVAATASKPGYGPALGTDGLAQLLRAPHPPVYALGGVTLELIPDLRRAGVHGVAVMGSVMRASHPGSVVAQLVAA